MIEHDSVLVKYNEIWNKVKKTLSIKFHCMPVYNEKYIKAKVMAQIYQVQKRKFLILVGLFKKKQIIMQKLVKQKVKY